MPTAEEAEAGKVYAIGYAYDPVIQKKVQGKYTVPFAFIDIYKLFSEKNDLLQDGNKVIEALQKSFNFPINFMFALDSGDIGFSAAGLIPKRKHSVV